MILIKVRFRFRSNMIQLMVKYSDCNDSKGAFFVGTVPSEVGGRIVA